ncbi:unnamed protein product [Danaus chrysippus]|uniref:(African queen) hypothetical protein n=1 Tax=Danaus chrysippus TaxID=151541 RepID=A0A8J2R8I1_9NEOP|nr:unnamed protein product [Danaus chrysippus]
MKFVVSVFVLALVAVALGDKPHYDVNNAPALFEKYIKDYNKSYKDAADREVHYQAFVKSLQEINEANARPSGTIYDLNNFSDYTPEEQQKMRGLLIPALVAVALGDKPHYDVNNAPALFEKYIKDYNKSYKDAADREVHYQAFVKTLKVINEANARPSDATYDLNNFSDYTPEEQQKMRGLLIPGNY